MVALVPVPASVTAKNSTANTGEVLPTINTGIAGEAFDAGDGIYLKESDNRYYKAANGAEATADITNGGIAMAPADAAGDAAIFCDGDGDRIDLGVSATEDESYWVGSTAGDLIPTADLATNNWKSRWGIGNAAGELVLDKKVTGEQHS